MMRMAWTSVTDSNGRPWGRWLVITAVVLLLSACQGLDSQMAQLPQPVPRDATSLDGQAPLPQQIAPATTTQNPNSESTNLQSLSDSTAMQPAAPLSILDPQVRPAQHTVQGGPQVAGAYAPRGYVAQPCPTPMAYAPYGQPNNCQSCQPQSCQPTGQQYGPQPWCPDSIPCNGWRPPGLRCPWPDDEYLCDGGDKIPSVKVRPDWSVDGLELEDTVVHFDTLNGNTHVEPSNRVCIYAPRFASVRKVYGIIQYKHLDRVGKVDQPVPVEGLGDVQVATMNVQPVQPLLNLGSTNPSGFRDPTPPIGLENRQGLIGIHGRVLPYEDITDLQRKLLTNSEKARLADMILAAAVWSHDTAVQVVIDNIAAHEDIVTTATDSVHIYSLEGKPRLRVCKLADRKEARPGEIVEFTLQFENVGDQTIGNVTVIDNLTTRLEYVADSENCTLESNFSTSDNQGESLTLRWEIVQPMKVGEGGVIRFKCRVR